MGPRKEAHSKAAAHGSLSGKRRSRTGCGVCRARKVKCDERPGSCLNCERLDLACPGSGDNLSALSPGFPATRANNCVGNASFTKAGIRRRRTYRSCLTCRSSKSRCSGEEPACTRCLQRQIDCVYDNASHPDWTKVISPAAPSVQDVSMGAQHAFQDDGGRSEATEQHLSAGQGDLAQECTLLLEVDSPSPRRPSNPPVDAQKPNPLFWLTSADLPEKDRLLLVVEEYFANIHPLRCLGFIHKPSFMQRLNEGLASDYRGTALLLIVCALGAKFYALNYSHSVQRLSVEFVLSAGNGWAKRAHALLFANLSDISFESTMAAVLLYDHELRVGNYAGAFLLTGLSVRMAQALQFNLEYSPDILCRESGSGPSASAKEARRRLMWSCYIMDSWVGSGVDQLTLMDVRDLQIQLPCDDRNFLFQIPCITEMMEPGKILSFVPEELRPLRAAENLGLMAYFVRITELRKRVLRYVKHLDTAQPAWLPQSEFADIDSAFDHWRETLPVSLQFSNAGLYMRKESGQVGALCLLHITYNQSLLDLYRIGMPKLFRIRFPIEFPPEQHEFLRQIRDKCFEHAKTVSSIFAEAIQHGAKTLSDTWFSTVAYDSSRVMLYYLTQVVGRGDERSETLWKETAPLLQANLRAQRLMIPMYSMAQPLYEAAASMLKKAGFDLTPVPENPAYGDPLLPEDGEMPSIPGTPSQITPEYVLNPLAIYRMARSSVRDKHAPDRSVSGTSSIPLGSKSDNRVQHGNHHSVPSSTPQDHPTPQSPVVSVTYMSPRVEDSIASPQQSLSFNELQSFFPSDFGSSWQPAETAFGNTEWVGGLPPWAPGLGSRIQDSIGVEGQFDLFTPFDQPLPWSSI